MPGQYHQCEKRCILISSKMEITWSITSNQHEENQNIRNNGNLTIATFMIKEREDMMKLELEEDDD